MNVISLMPAAVRYGFGLLLAAAILGGAWLHGHRSGYATADAMRRAEVAEIRAVHAADRETQQRILAQAERTARERLEAEIVRADALAADLSQARGRIAAQAREITSRRIEDVSASAPDCRFGPDFVRLCNEAAGADPAASGLPGNAPGPARPSQAGFASSGIHAGIPRADEVAGPADLLAWLRDYGAWCRENAAQLTALIEWDRGRRR